jgi:uncharacterized delta-60 repeat protein
LRETVRENIYIILFLVYIRRMSSSTSALFKKVDSSDYITAKKRMTISKEYINSNNAAQFNPLKNNGSKYNKNYRFIPTQNGTNCLISSNSFELLDNYNVGTTYLNQQCGPPNGDGLLDPLFNIGSGFNSPANYVAIQSDDKIIVGGTFQSYNGNSCNYIARLNSDGTFDNGFNFSGTGFDGVVSCFIIQSTGQIIVGGQFQSYNGNSCKTIARLNNDGTFDTGFNSGGEGFNSLIRIIKAQTNGKIIVAGNFTNYNDINGNHPCNFIARLNNDGTFDTGFNSSGTGFNGFLYWLVTQSTGQIIVGGDFLNYNDIYGDHPCNYIARLNEDGTFDTGFNSGSGFDDTSISAVIQPSDGKIIISGYFTTYDGNAMSGIVRINFDGTFDNEFNSGGSGLNLYYTAYTLSVQSDGKILLGGEFISYNGIPCGYIARLNPDGTLDNAFIQNNGSGFDQKVNSLASQSTGKIITVGNFQHFNNIPVNFIARLYV